MTLDDLVLNPELFVIPIDGNENILYAPLSGSVARVNGGVIGILKQIQLGEYDLGNPDEIVTQLKDQRILVEKEKADIFKESQLEVMSSQVSSEYKPISVTLMPTFDCTMRCVYCFSEGGDGPTPPMDFKVAKSAIDLITTNAVELEQNRASLGFHGGGEPFFPGTLGLVKESVKYFQDKCAELGLNPSISSATNGVINPRQLDWIMENFDHLNLSLDGPEDVQNLQRPLCMEKGSFDYVIQTIETLNKHEFPFGIRATVTDYSVARMSELIEFFHDIAPNNKSFHLEPLFECGRCDELDERSGYQKAPSQADFMKYSVEARATADKLGLKLNHSSTEVERLSTYFCGALGKNFFVTPDGNVTSCLETCRDDDSGTNPFFIGSYNPEKDAFEFDEDRISSLQNRRVETLENCTDCFAKYNCSGDCPAKVHSSGVDFEKEGGYRCDSNRAILLDQLIKKTGGKN